jgi:putative acetyltransferase
MIEIIPFEDVHKLAFYQLNLQWLQQYDLAESHDLEILNNPRQTIIDGGGCIFIARDGGTVVGTAALIKVSEKEYELAKMTVAEACRGRGLSKLLMQRCLCHARLLNAAKITLFSNHQLSTALKLYEQFGFTHIAVEHSPFETADVKMQLLL